MLSSGEMLQFCIYVSDLFRCPVTLTQINKITSLLLSLTDYSHFHCIHPSHAIIIPNSFA